MSAIYIKKAEKQHLPQMMEIIEDAKTLLKKDGSSQWQDGYPDQTALQMDIDKGDCYLLMVDDEIAGTATLVAGEDPNYAVIYEGEWQEASLPYAAIHRIAISGKFRGLQLGKLFFSNLISLAYAKGIEHIRIDTHEINQRMQKLVLSFGFTYRGIIYVSAGIEGKRKAYELNLTDKKI